MKLNNILIFALGAGLGSVTAFFITKRKYEKIAEEEIQEVKQFYAEKLKKHSEKTEEVPEDVVKFDEIKNQTVNKKPITDYNNIINRQKYTSEEVKPEDMNVEERFEYSPDDFGEKYEPEFATLYADGYLVDDNDHILNIEDCIGGEEAYEHFGEGDEEDLLHVRNNLYSIDYEIVKDDRTYAAVSGKDEDEIKAEVAGFSEEDEDY